MTTAPVLFISHGAPTFATEPGVLGPKLTALGEYLQGMAAVLVISPHWQTEQVTVMTTAAPQTIHDFGGFPPQLYRLQYAVAGHPALAANAASLLADAGFEVRHDPQRGLDHGAWVPLRYLFPQARTPVFQISLPVDLDTADAVKLGKALAPLRERGVLLVGSGSVTHNLYEFRQDAAEEAAYAKEFTQWVRDAVVTRDVGRLADYRLQAPHALRAHPSEEHFLPLLVAAGASAGTDVVEVIEGGMTYGVLSMESYLWGPQRTGRTSRKKNSRKRASLSDSQLSALCHPLQFLSTGTSS